MKAPISNDKEGLEFFKSWIKNKPVAPTVVKLNLTERCNSRCKMCFYWRKKPLDDMPSKVVEQLLNELACLGTKTITFSGGEALLHKDIIPLIKTASKKGFRTILLTNGLLVSKEKAKEIVLAGTNTIEFSIDSHKRKTNDEIRGIKGAYDKAVNGIKFINLFKKKYKKNISVTLCSVLNAKNYKDMHKILLLKKYGVNSFHFYPMRPYVGQKPNPELNTTKKQENFFAKKTLPKLISLAKKNGLNKKEIYRAIYMFIESNPKPPCFLPMFHATIDTDGEVFPCCHAADHRQIKSVSMGNILNNTFKKIWLGKKFHKFRKSTKHKLYFFCNDCIYTNTNTECQKALVYFNKEQNNNQKKG